MNMPLSNASNVSSRVDGSDQRKSASADQSESGDGQFKKVVKELRDTQNRSGDKTTTTTAEQEPKTEEQTQASLPENSSPEAGTIPEGAGKAAVMSGEELIPQVEADNSIGSGSEVSVPSDISKLLKQVTDKAVPQKSEQSESQIASGGASASLARSMDTVASASQVVNEAHLTQVTTSASMAQVLASLSPQRVQVKPEGAQQPAQTGTLKQAVDAGNVKLPEASGLGKTVSEANVHLETGKAVEAAMKGQSVGEANTTKSFNGSQQQIGSEVKVLSVETYLPPASETGRPSLQVANALNKTLHAAQSASQQTQDAAMHLQQAQVTKPVKSLQIQLRPDNLGTVTANMQVRGGELEVSLMTTTREAAEMLRGDRHALVRVLQDAGYRTDSVNVSVNVREDMSEQMRQSGQNSQRFAQEQNSGEGGEHERNQGLLEDEHLQENAGENYKDRSTAPDLRRGLYL